MSRRSQMFLLLVVSVLLHAALFAALSRIPPPARRPAVAGPIEWEVVPPEERPVPPPPAQPLAPTREKPPRRVERPRPVAPSTPNEAPPQRAERPSSPAEAPAPSAQRPSPPQEAPARHAERPSGPSEPEASAAPPPLARDVPRASPSPDLEPPGLLGGGLLKGPPSTGRTLRNSGEAPDREALVAREAEEVGKRVDGWAQDAAATARASGGVVHPYFAKLQKGFAKQLVDPPAPDLKVLASRMKREQLDAIQRFGKTGTPLVAEPRDLRLETRNRMQAAVEAGRAANMYMVDVTAPVLALAAVVEVRQARDGKLLDLKVLEGSGDPKFDVWAVAQLKEALAVADPPQEGTRGAGIHDDGMASRWRLEEYLGNPRVQIHLIGIY
ncbi:ferrichrome ABC transporter substrate-binding protein [Corallococcus sp. bb12-1]|uniref:ferrichrome ABC transporter substrate-binding protein n=1 Tax=Corallococcus sp. bb12-1 TaxID=2996784 RepID=UPI002271D251|nr:ferrichrome ABC transporter substrate-binding protein [Corallococcus sp. bb12-1]MCY1039686.1 ferrichrome ABC transporter substrate-binding protein [Corallococcus sp. bb12-1]